MPVGPIVYERSAYGSAYLQVVALRPLRGAPFDLRLIDGALYYEKEDCGPADTGTRFFLDVFPLHAKDLPAHRRAHRFDNRDFDFDRRGRLFKGWCITWEPLPDYPIARIRTGQFAHGGPVIWKADFDLAKN